MSRQRDAIEFLSQRGPVRADLQNAMADALAAFLERHGIIIPYPPYGSIQNELPDEYLYTAIADRLERDRSQIHAFLDRTRDYFYAPALDSIPEDENDAGPGAPFWRNRYFSRADARMLYAVAGALNPRRWIEVGVGHSTRFLRKAISDQGLSTEIVSIDPAPRADIEQHTDQHIQQNVLDVPLDVFAELQPGDVFFMDGSHVMLAGTDVTHVFLNVLPVLKPGVLVHIHDIYLPYEYPVRTRAKQFNEQHALAMLLLFSRAWEVLAPIHYLKRTNVIEFGGGSFWMRRVIEG